MARNDNNDGNNTALYPESDQRVPFQKDVPHVEKGRIITSKTREAQSNPPPHPQPPLKKGKKRKER